MSSETEDAVTHICYLASASGKKLFVFTLLSLFSLLFACFVLKCFSY